MVVGSRSAVGCCRFQASKAKQLRRVSAYRSGAIAFIVCQQSSAFLYYDCLSSMRGRGGTHPPVGLQALSELHQLPRDPPLIPVAQQVVQLPLQISYSRSKKVAEDQSRLSMQRNARPCMM